MGIISAVSTKAVIAAIGTKLFLAKIIIAYAVTYSVTYIATGSQSRPRRRTECCLFMGIGELRGGKMGANGKMQYNPGWESGSMKTLAAHGLAGGIVQDRMGVVLVLVFYQVHLALTLDHQDIQRICLR
ncbi:hypothetical protein BSPWISOXPB_7270 [uncultured Gammaproteobacteria bacterium]|nr:hypothetical protein BSPWISOXPB_7270 [uncultured Gammaproteobacteria bacterium]